MNWARFLVWALLTWLLCLALLTWLLWLALFARFLIGALLTWLLVWTCLGRGAGFGLGARASLFSQKGKLRADFVARHVVIRPFLGLLVLLADVLRRVLVGLVGKFPGFLDRLSADLLSLLDGDFAPEVPIGVDDLDGQDHEQDYRKDPVQATILAISFVDLLLGFDLLAKNV